MFQYFKYLPIIDTYLRKKAMALKYGAQNELAYLNKIQKMI
jgi:hypothetical protein